MENNTQTSEILSAIQLLATKMDQSVKELNDKMDEGFKSVNERLDKVEARLDRVEARLDTLERKVDSVQDEVAGLKEWKTVTDTRLDVLENVSKNNSFDINSLRVIK